MSQARKLVFGVITNVVLLSLLEAGARLFTNKPPETKYPPLEFVANDFKNPVPGFPDPDLLWRMPPHSVINPGTGELTNNLGFRGPDVTIEKPAGTRRIVCLGSSATFGLETGGSSVYTNRLSRWLNLSKDTKWEVVNLGIPNSSPLQTLQVYKQVATRLSPDIVILYTGTWHAFTPAIDMDDEAALERMKQMKAVRSGFSARRLRLYQWITWWLAPEYKSKRQDYIDRWGKFAQRPDGPRVSPTKFKKYIGEMIKSAKESGYQTFLVVPPVRDSARTRIHDSDIYAEIVKSYAPEVMGVIDARANLDPLEEEDLFKNDILPSENGHQLIAKLVAEEFKRANVPGLPNYSVALLDTPPISLSDLRTDAEFTTGDPPQRIPAADVIRWDPVGVSIMAPGKIVYRNIRIPAQAALVFQNAIFTRRDFSQGGPASRPTGRPVNVKFNILIQPRDTQTATEPRVIFEDSISGDGSTAWVSHPAQRVDLGEFADRYVNIIFQVSGWAYCATFQKATIFPFR